MICGRGPSRPVLRDQENSAMNPPVQVTCPNCRNVLRVPPNLGDASVKCKHCGFILQLKKKAAPPPPPPAARPAMPTQPTARPAAAPPTPYANTTAPLPARPMATPQTRPAPASAMPFSLDDLPEYIPPVQAGAPTGYGPAAYGPAPAAYGHAPMAAPMPLVEPVPTSAPSDFNPAFETAGRRHTGRGAYRGPRSSGLGKWIALGVVLLVGSAALAIVLFKREWFGDKPGGHGQEQVKGDQKDGNNPGTSNNKEVTIRVDPGKKPGPAAQVGPMPRRILAISINEYLYVNPVRYGNIQVLKDSERKDFYKAIERLATGWKVPKDQVYYLTDGPVDNSRIDSEHPPLKPVVEGAIENFLTASRAQDRIVIVFSGHAIEKDGEAFLVPLEGEFDEPSTLIPLKSIYEKLAKCPAQEKLIIFDVCRFDPGRGIERPIFGEMTPELEKALHESPDGVSVLTSCSAGQFAYEYELWEAHVPGLYRQEQYGSFFTSLFFAADNKALLSKMTRPEDPLPLGTLLDYLNEFVPAAVKDLVKKEQKPKYTPKLRKEWLAYNKDEPLARRVEFPKPPPTAKPAEVKKMFEELDLPPIKSAIQTKEKDLKFADNYPFTEESLKDYFNSGPSFEDIQKAPEKYKDEFPLRVATVNALLEMRKLKATEAKDELPDRFKAPISDMIKARITGVYQRTITTRQGILQDQLDDLAAAEKHRDKEKSKRWVANYDYAYAQAKIRFAYIAEYNLAFGKVKTDALPELTEEQAKTGGWVIFSQDKMASPKDIRDLAEEGKQTMAELAKANPNTPWAVVAKMNRGVILGVVWQASNFAAEENKP
jgi:hypothetical protein